MPYQPIACHLFDYIEIACIRHYTLSIKLISGEKVIAKAMNTLIKNKQEFLVLERDSSKIKIRLDTIKSLEPMEKEADFGPINLQWRLRKVWIT